MNSIIHFFSPPPLLRRQRQWEIVIGNFRRYLNIEKKDAKYETRIETYKFDKDKPMSKGEKTSEYVKKDVDDEVKEEKKKNE